MKAVVIDASAVLALLLGNPAAKNIAEHLREAEGNIYAPHLLHVEVARVLRRFADAHPDQAERCREALLDLRKMPIFLWPLDPCSERLWELCQSFTVSDASYLALAEYLEAPFLTCDPRLERTGHTAELRLVRAHPQ